MLNTTNAMPAKPASVLGAETAEVGVPSCLDENRILDFVAGRLSDENRTEVYTHVDTCEHCRMLLAYASTRSGSRATEQAGQPQSLPRVGQVIAERFVLVRLLGWGGMGVVFAAEDQQLRVPVALKLLHLPGQDRERVLRHVRREIRTGRRVHHPNVCRIFDFGSSDGFDFITMELVEGQTLTEVVQQPLDEARVVDILGQLCEALYAAHEKGVIHRDLKPSNIMLESSGRVVVMDFGLARDLDDELTADSGLVGTPAYWAPEQLRGAPATVASDVDAVGLLAYQLFSGAAPRTLADRGALRRIPPPYRNLVRRCLRVAPSARFPDAMALGRSLRHSRFLSRHRRPLAMAAAALVLVGGSAGYAALAPAEAPKTPATTVSPPTTSDTSEPVRARTRDRDPQAPIRRQELAPTTTPAVSGGSVPARPVVHPRRRPLPRRTAPPSTAPAASAPRASPPVETPIFD